MSFHIFKHFRYKSLILDTKLTLCINFTLPSHKTIFAYMESHWKNQAPEELLISYSNDMAYDLDCR